MSDTTIAKTTDELESDAAHLADLLDVAIQLHQETEFTRPDGSRDREKDRLHSILWVARDIAERLKSDLEAQPSPQVVEHLPSSSMRRG